MARFFIINGDLFFFKHKYACCWVQTLFVGVGRNRSLLRMFQRFQGCSKELCIIMNAMQQRPAGCSMFHEHDNGQQCDQVTIVSMQCMVEVEVFWWQWSHSRHRSSGTVEVSD